MFEGLENEGVKKKVEKVWEWCRDNGWILGKDDMDSFDSVMDGGIGGEIKESYERGNLNGEGGIFDNPDEELTKSHELPFPYSYNYDRKEIPQVRQDQLAGGMTFGGSEGTMEDADADGDGDAEFEGIDIGDGEMEVGAEEDGMMQDGGIGSP
jgi:hypothetical protein